MIKDIAIHLTGSSEDAVRLDYAKGLADRLDAHLTGLQVTVLPSILSYTDPSGSFVLQELIKNTNNEADAIGTRLQNSLSTLGRPAELRRLDVYPEDVGASLATQVRLADIFIGTRPYGDSAKAARIEETVLFQGGRGCIFLPPQVASQPKLDRIVIAWKNTREAARAVAEAMPLIKLANAVDVVLVAEDDSALRQMETTEIGRYLARHGVNAEIRSAAAQPDIGQALLREAKASAADLLVMGAYGHSRLRELVLGGATRDVLSHAAIPVFVAH